MTQEFVTLPREVVEQAMSALEFSETQSHRNQYDVEASALAALSAALEQPQANQPAMTPVAQRKLEDLMESGYTISGYSVYHERKHQHGFVTGAGLVGWWKPEGVEYPQPQGNQEPVAWCALNADRSGIAYFDGRPIIMTGPIGNEHHPDPLYTRPQPEREPLTDMQKMMCWSRATHDADVWHKTEHQCLMDYGAEIEAAHNIK